MLNQQEIIQTISMIKDQHLDIRTVTMHLSLFDCISDDPKKTAANVSDDRKRKYTVEVEVVRVKITLACTECKQRNYNMTKEKKNHPDRMETSKYCRFCRKHTLHKETK